MQKVLPMRSYYISSYNSQTGYHFVKRCFDIVLSVVLMIILLPVAVIVAIVAAIDTKSNPIFVQTRMGRNNQPFKIIKFRTMSTSAPSNMATHKLKNSENYISRTGKLLRKLSLDELPQLWNILMGDMSFVGPRPVVLTETDLLALRVKNGAVCIRPGLTGWAQVNGRDNLPIRDKANLDGEYAQSISLSMDIKVMLKTIGYVLRSEGVSDGENQDISKPVSEKKSVDSGYRTNRSA